MDTYRQADSDENAYSSMRRLIDRLGGRLMAYVLNMHQESASRIGDGREDEYLTAQQMQVLQLLCGFGEQIDTAGQQPYASVTGEWSITLAIGFRTRRELETSFANDLRAAAAGRAAQALTRPTSLDDMMIELAKQLYPVYLMPMDRFRFSPAGVGVFLANHAWREDLESLMISDPVFATFLTERDDMGPRSAHVWWSSGRSDTIQLSILCGALIGAGWERACMAAAEPTIDQFLEAVHVNLGDAREVIQGRQITIQTKVGLAGAVLAEQIDAIDLGVATIRKRDARDDYAVDMAGVVGAVGAIDQRGESISISYAGDLVAEFAVPFQMARVKGDIYTFTPPAHLPDTRKEIASLIDNIRLAFLLAIPDRAPALHTIWSEFIAPISYGNGGSWDPYAQVMTGLSPVTIDSAEAESWRKWLEIIHRYLVPGVGVAVRRMLAAVSQRRSPEDVLVDAVIVWENLFGAKTETTMRVSASLAWLLGKSAEDRMQRYKEYKDIYNFRSKLVHGDPKPDPVKVQMYSRRAVEVSIEALREILENQPSLFEIGNSDDRSLALILRG